jgi:hypothetical protein
MYYTDAVCLLFYLSFVSDDVGYKNGDVGSSTDVGNYTADDAG